MSSRERRKLLKNICILEGTTKSSCRKQRNVLNVILLFLSRSFRYLLCARAPLVKLRNLWKSLNARTRVWLRSIHNLEIWNKQKKNAAISHGLSNLLQRWPQQIRFIGCSFYFYLRIKLPTHTDTHSTYMWLHTSCKYSVVKRQHEE